MHCVDVLSFRFPVVIMACNITGGHLQGSSGLVTMIQRCGILCTTHYRINNLGHPDLMLTHTRQVGPVVAVAWLLKNKIYNVQNAKLVFSFPFNSSQMKRYQIQNCISISPMGQVLNEIFSQFEVSGFCDSIDNTDLCSSFLLMATTQGLPLLAEGMIPDTWLQDRVCNQAVPGTC